MSQVAHWCFTTYDVANFGIPEDTSRIKYMIYQAELCPETGKEHFQGYIEFFRSVRMNAVKKILNDNTMHLEPRSGTRDKARDYCRKEDTHIDGPWEFGTWEESQSGKRNDLIDLCSAIDEGKKDWELKELYPSTFLRYQKHVGNYRNVRKPVPREVPHVEYIYGKTGTGKTKSVYDRESLDDLYVCESELKWFDGYSSQPSVLIDDFNGQCKIEFLLRLLDRYPLQVPIKGGFTNWEPNRIYITSNLSIADLYPNISNNHREALIRRITIIKSTDDLQEAQDQSFNIDEDFL